jgi:hypothetical protein
MLIMQTIFTKPITGVQFLQRKLLVFIFRVLAYFRLLSLIFTDQSGTLLSFWLPTPAYT